MIEELKELQSDDIIILLEDEAIEFTGMEEMTVTGVRVYTSDDSELVMVEMDDFYLVAHNFQSEEQYFIYQLVDEGDVSDLEDNGYKFLNEDDDFRHKIVNREEGKAHVFTHSETGAIYGLTKTRDDEGDDQEVSLCEYKSNSAQYNHILIEQEDGHTRICQGFEITEFEIAELE